MRLQGPHAVSAAAASSVVRPDYDAVMASTGGARRNVGGILRRHAAGPAGGAPPALDRETRVRVQRALAAQGFDPGHPDGAFGPRSGRSWQQATGHVRRSTAVAFGGGLAGFCARGWLDRVFRRMRGIMERGRSRSAGLVPAATAATARAGGRSPFPNAGPPTATAGWPCPARGRPIQNTPDSRSASWTGRADVRQAAEGAVLEGACQQAWLLCLGYLLHPRPEGDMVRSPRASGGTLVWAEGGNSGKSTTVHAVGLLLRAVTALRVNGQTGTEATPWATVLRARPQYGSRLGRLHPRKPAGSNSCDVRPYLLLRQACGRVVRPTLANARVARRAGLKLGG